MEKEKKLIKRKDGIEYYRNSPVKIKDKYLNVRTDDTMINDLKEIASRLGVKYQSLIKKVLQDYIDKNK